MYVGGTGERFKDRVDGCVMAVACVHEQQKQQDHVHPTQTSEDWQALHDILAFDMQLAPNRKQRSFTVKGKRRDRWVLASDWDSH